VHNANLLKDELWKGFRIDVQEFLPDGFMVHAWDKRKLCAGYAKVSVHRQQAKLGDIYVLDRLLPRFKWCPWYKPRINYRNQGLGSQILRCVIIQCHILGIHELSGEIVGDREALTLFYRRHGFSINGTVITLDLHSLRGRS